MFEGEAKLTCICRGRRSRDPLATNSLQSPDEVGMKRKPLGAWAITGALLTAFVVGPAAAQDANVNQVLAAEAQRIERARQAQRQIDQIAEQTRQRFNDYQTVLKEIDGLRLYNDLMQARIDDQERQIAELRASIDTVTVIERQVTPLMVRMIDGLEKFIELDVPFRLAERRQRVANLRALLQRSDVTTAEQFRNVMQAWQIENDYGRFADFYVGELEIGGVTREVEFLMLGRVGFYYVTPDNTAAGAWDQRSREWVALTRADAEQIRQGLNVLKSGGAPQLFMVPIAPPQEN
nr:hypothetical protein [Gammaproteobacteria bacterium]